VLPLRKQTPDLRMKNYKTIFWKVVLGFGIVACLLATTYWITYNNLKTLKTNINALAELNPRNVYRKKIAHTIDDIDYYIKQYAVTKNDSLLQKFDTCVENVGHYMDQLSKIALEDSAYSFCYFLHLLSSSLILIFSSGTERPCCSAVSA